MLFFWQFKTRHTLLFFIYAGFLLNLKIFEPLQDYELFDDAHFWTIPDESPKKDTHDSTAVEMTMLEKDA